MGLKLAKNWWHKLLLAFFLLGLPQCSQQYAFMDVGQILRWDIRFFAEHEQPAYKIPEVSIVNIDETSSLMDQLFPNTPYEAIPYPVKFDPQTSLHVGSRDVGVECDLLQPGEGHCVAFEDWLVEGATDADYDHLFQVKPEEKRITIYADTITSVGAKNRTDLILFNPPPGWRNVRIQFFHRDNESPQEGFVEFQVQRELHLSEEDGNVRINLWEDQKDMLEGGKYTLMIVIDFLF